ncbi:pilus assembly protein PilY [Acinetobacter lanii]|uniref:Pilus assembly protein PilY n=2 Tax=Acinetobacter lanii TaxID=2715163 RepID=A0A6G8S8D2_9GAMM|nr:pilus assembly protein PilY [Acinetobacter lanii]
MTRLLPRQVLVASMSAILSGLVLTSAVQASDIEIYQKAKEGDRTLMFLLDVSTSMDRSVDTVSGSGYACDLPKGVTDTGLGITNTVNITHGKDNKFVTSMNRVHCLGSDQKQYYDRITRVKDAMIDVLLGNTQKKITALDGKYIIGLSTLGHSKGGAGVVVVPARPLNEIIDATSGKTQRDLMVEEVAKLKGVSATPTARSFAEVAAYLLGTNTNSNILMRKYYQSMGNRKLDGSDPWSCKSPLTNTANDYRTYKATDGALAGQNIDIAWCQDGPNSSWNPQASSYNPPLVRLSDYASSGRELWFDPTERQRNAIDVISGFAYSTDTAKVTDKSRYSNPSSINKQLDYEDSDKACHGQAIYMLTDGEPNNGSDSSYVIRSALGNKASELMCTDSDSGSDCSLKLAEILVDASRNPAKVSFKTAMVGFGNDFNGIPSSVTTEQEVDAVTGVSASVKNAAKLGIRGKGGWYSGSKSEDIVNSIQALIDSISADIPSVTTGSPTVAKDSLNPSVLQSTAYYPQFQPTPDKSYQTWIGNLKKYDINDNGQLIDKNKNTILDTHGNLIDHFDLWSTSISPSAADGDENTIGSRKFALKGGVWSQLKLKLNDKNTENRKVLTNRIVDSKDAAQFKGGTTLRQIRVSDLNALDSAYKADPSRAHLISLLGYSVDPTNLNNINLSQPNPELRQIGAVMHSSPLLLTNKGEVVYDYDQQLITTKQREDYILFGSTQGLLHVVDAETGEEKFAFVPNEMVENQKEAFLKSDLTTGGLDKLFYGIDGPWTSYTEYVIATDGSLTVAKGKENKSGKQHVYGGLRMGGRSYYALDLQNMNAPKLMFHISPADKKVYYNGSSKTFNELHYMGQSWSKPTIAWVKWGNSRKRVMFVGGGYDAGGVDGDARDSFGNKLAYAGYENPNYNPTLAQGAGVYMFDAENGDLLWWTSASAVTSSKEANSGVIGTESPNLKYSVVSEIRTEDRNSDGLTDHLYFGDLGGQVFRIDLNNQAGTLGAFVQNVHTLLDLHDGAKSPRFYEMPAFSIYDEAGKSFAVVSIGSGNRSLPMQEYSTSSSYDYDAIYNIYDKDVTASGLYTQGYTLKTILRKTDLNEITQENRIDDTTSVAPYTANGWYYKFKNGTAIQSAKVISSPVVANYRLYVSIFDSSKAGIGGQCGAGIKGESFLNTFCMPYGQCKKYATPVGEEPNQNNNEVECTTGDGCSIGAGLQATAVVPTKCVGESCTDVGGANPTTSSQDNGNYCLSAGQIGLTHKTGVTGKVDSKMCLIPQRWYQAFK